MAIPLRAALLCVTLFSIGVSAESKAARAGVTAPAMPARHTLTVSGRQFLMDGKPFQIISGEMHYTRVPRPYWRDRLRKARAMGLNTITTYVFWNVHEPRPGVFDFSGQNDLAEFIREAQAEGLNVILRPGPYVCAEWELGGYPAWLLKDRTLTLRSTEPKYTAAVNAWLARLAQEVTPLLAKNGGPIIAVQLENEYGSFGDDKSYLEGLKDELVKTGIGDSVLYTADGPAQLPKGSLPELPAVINFGTGDAHGAFARLEELRPDGPRMSGEYWAGWFDHWGEKHHVTDGDKEAAELRWMLEQGDSVSMYMFEGGTSFGWMNGANSNGSNYQPDTTSYDYDAPLAENGDPRAKYFAFRKAIEETTGVHPLKVPRLSARKAFPVSAMTASASLWRNLPTPVNAETPLTFEDMDQAYGYVLYRTSIDEGGGGKLVLEGLHDYAQVYVDQQLVGTLDRRLGTDSIDIPRQAHAATLDILVENSGRVNFTKVIRTERKGLTGAVTLDGKTPRRWEIYSLPMDDLSRVRFVAGPCTGPCFYQATLSVTKPADTYLDTRELHKGFAWLGTQPLGRFWSIGPQFALYTPGCWLQHGQNTVTIFDLLGDSADALKSTTEPILSGALATRD
ncbi:MAG TPA: beta-galactosidase family protein [Bryocella sp.]|nr:beta-galactosidase family protein [Bryocella sp.]